MKLTKSLLVLSMALLVAPAAMGAAPAIDPLAAKTAIKQKAKAKPPIKIVDDDASLAACQQFKDAQKKANDEFAACQDTDTAPAGSPVDKFNKASNLELATICGSKSLDQCVADVLKEQETFCKNKVAPLKAEAEKKKAECREARGECSAAQANLKTAEEALKVLDAKKKALETELAKATADVTAKTADVAKAKAAVDKECGKKK